MFKLIITYFTLMSASNCSTKLVASYLTPCPGLKTDCLTKIVQKSLPHFSKGISELGLASIDPLKEDRLVVTLPGGLKVELNNGSMTGLGNCKIDSVSHKNDEADLKMHCDLTITGAYKAQGKILIVNINGDGNAEVKIKNAFIHAKIRFEDKIRDGIVYYKVKKYNATFDYGDKVSFTLTNLFNGNVKLSEAVLQFLNQNWRQISEEFGKPLVDKGMERVFSIVKMFFTRVPKEELLYAISSHLNKN